MLDKLMGKGFYIINDIDLSEDEFVSLSSQFGKLWGKEDHILAKESLGGKVVNWSSTHPFVRASIPWHADNSACKDRKYPLRSFYAVSIPDPEDAKLYFLDITKAFEMFSDERKEHLRHCTTILGDNPSFKQGSNKWTFEEPWTEPFVKVHPIMKTESINYGCLALDSDVFGLGPDEGYVGTESYNKAILHPDGSKWTDDEVSNLFKELINNVGVYEHKWQERQFLVMDNSTHLHYKQTTHIQDKERLIWRRTIFQSWHTT